MTDGVMVALVSGIAPTLAALAGLFVSISNGHKADTNLKRADESLENTKETSRKTEEIHVLVNSNLSAVKADLALALERVAKLENLILKLSGKTNFESSSSSSSSMVDEISSKKAKDDLAKPNDQK